MTKHIQAEYSRKLTSPRQAVLHIKPGDRVFSALGAAEPPALIQAMADQAESLANVSLVQMLQFRKYDYIKPENRNNVRLDSWFSSAQARQAINEGWGDFTPQHFHDVPYLLRYDIVPIDVFMAAVTPMNEQGFFSLGASVCFAFDAIKKARLVIFEVNEHMPYTCGNTLVHISEVDHLVENHVPMPQMTSAPPNSVQKTIGSIIADLIEDGSTVQLGFGGIPMAMAEFLKEKKNLGIHTELVVDAMVDLVECGAVTNHLRSVHKGKITGTSLVGTDKVYKYSHNNPQVELHPVDYTNDVSMIASNNKMVAVNATLEVDLFGQCVSESIGFRHYSGSGGQADFCRGAVKSPGGKSILALPSTTKNDTISKIVPSIQTGAVVTVARNDVDYIVTEYGAVRLRGKSQRERALALISVAHPNFRDQLRFHAEKIHLI